MAIMGFKKSPKTIEEDYLEMLIGDEEKDHILVEFIAYEFPDETQYWEANWLKVIINLKVGAFTAKYKGRMKAYNLKDFKRGLERERFYENQKGISAYLQCYEKWLDVKLTTNGKGGYEAECIASDSATIGTQLNFKLKLKKPQVESLNHQVNDILKKFPVRGTK